MHRRGQQGRHQQPDQPDHPSGHDPRRQPAAASPPRRRSNSTKPPPTWDRARSRSPPTLTSPLRRTATPARSRSRSSPNPNDKPCSPVPGREHHQIPAERTRARLCWRQAVSGAHARDPGRGDPLPGVHCAAWNCASCRLRHRAGGEIFGCLAPDDDYRSAPRPTAPRSLAQPQRPTCTIPSRRPVPDATIG